MTRIEVKRLSTLLGRSPGGISPGGLSPGVPIDKEQWPDWRSETSEGYLTANYQYLRPGQGATIRLTRPYPGLDSSGRPLCPGLPPKDDDDDLYNMSPRQSPHPCKTPLRPFIIEGDIKREMTE